MIERVVFDTSTLIGALLKPGSTPHRALMIALDSCAIYSCEQALRELADVLSRSHFDRYASPADRAKFAALVQERSEILWIDEAEAASLAPSCRDPKDNFVLALALAAEAGAIVSSDHDLLALNPWRGIPILTPAGFVAQSAA